MKFKSYAAKEQARIAIKESAAMQGGRLGVGEVLSDSGSVCAVGALAKSIGRTLVVGREYENATAMDAMWSTYFVGEYGNTFPIWSSNDDSDGDPEAVLAAIDRIPVEGE